jgi:acetyltransferase-like isoleucine patch superfamily enzyme
MKSFSSMVRSLPRASRMVLNKSHALRHIRNKWRYPALECDPTVNFAVQGEVEYAAGASLGTGCNIIVSEGTKLVLGKSCFIGRYVEIGPGPLIEIGDSTSIQDRCVILGEVKLGRFCVLSYDLYISSGHHIFDRKPHAMIRDQDREFGDATDAPSHDTSRIIVEDDVWLGVHVVVMPGVTIGRGCVIGANSVVTRSLLPYSVAAGAPARVIRKRLEFAPPAAIDWQNENDIPYFYRGFETSIEERRRHANMGGHFAAGDFAISLRQPSSKVCVHMKCLSEGGTVIECGGKSYALSDRSAVYEFDSSSQDCDRPVFSTFTVKGGPVVVTGAWAM